MRYLHQRETPSWENSRSGKLQIGGQLQVGKFQSQKRFKSSTYELTLNNVEWMISIDGTLLSQNHLAKGVKMVSSESQGLYISTVDGKVLAGWISWNNIYLTWWTTFQSDLSYLSVRPVLPFSPTCPTFQSYLSHLSVLPILPLSHLSSNILGRVQFMQW
jgi:hypothetical protein